MNSEQQNELINFLKTLGFEGEDIERELTENVGRNLLMFSLDIKKTYDEETMFFKLLFKNDPQFSTYRLDRYSATHRDEVFLEHKNINGIDTAELESQMKGFDWQRYFDGQLPQSLYDQGLTIFKLLNKLSEGDDFQGKQVQAELMLKYFPDKYNEHELKQYVKSLHEQSRDFVPHETGICNANLAYHILSGRLADLHEKILYISPEQFSKEDVHQKLETALSENLKEFELTLTRNEPEGFAELKIPISTKEDWYFVDNYSIAFTSYPTIDHATYSGVDTKELEARMQEIDWQNDRSIFIFHEDWEPTFPPKVDDIQMEIYKLSLDTAGSPVADMLQLKYWTNVIFFGENFQESTWNLLEQLPKIQQDFPVELKAKAAYNLMAGRAVWIDPAPGESEKWMKLNPNPDRGMQKYPVIYINGFSRQELEDQLKLLPFENSKYYPVLHSIMIGDLTKVDLTNGKKIAIKASPEQNAIELFTPKHRPIPFNFSFDPDWKPGHLQGNKREMEIQKNQQRTPKIRLNNSYKKGKGKRL